MSSALTRPAYICSKLSLEEVRLADRALRACEGRTLIFGGRKIVLPSDLEKRRELALELMGHVPQYKKPSLKKKAK